MEYLRTPEECFENIADFPYKPRYLQHNDLRMAYIDEQTGDGHDVFLCLHGEPTWSYLYRKMIPVFLNYGANSETGKLSRRVIAPDFFGFGRSDKPSAEAAYDFDFHRNAVLLLIKELDLTNVTLVVQDWGGAIGLTLPIAHPSRFKRLVVMNTAIGGSISKSPKVQDWIDYSSNLQSIDPAELMGVLGHHLSEEQKRAYRAPFPDDTYTVGVKRFPQMIMTNDSMPGVEISRKAREFFQTTDSFQKKDIFIVAGMQDAILGPYMRVLAKGFKNGCFYTEIEEASHFVQEWGDRVAKLAIDVFEGSNQIKGIEDISS